jgi:flavin reductase (NADH)
MDRHPIQARIDPDRGDDRSGPGVSVETFREALSHWATTVTIVAVREADRVHATTVSSFAPVSADPPLIVVSLGANAQVLPWLERGVTFAVSLLAENQNRLASVFADSYPVGPSPFPDEGDPVVTGAMASLICSVRDVIPTESDARLVLGRVKSASHDDRKGPLLYQRRGYRRLDEEE